MHDKLRQYPQLGPRLAKWMLFVAEDAVETHRVVDFGGAEVEQVGNFADRQQRDTTQFVLHEMQRRQRHGLFARIARQIIENPLPQFGI